MVTTAQILAIMPNAKRAYNPKVPKSKSCAETYLPYFNQFMEQYKVTTPLEKAYFFATIAIESGELRYAEEIADGSQYEGRKDLGNTVPGYGVRFKGRGLMQITGFYNYWAYSKSVGYDFYSTSERAKGLSKPGNAVRVSFWYWWSNNLNALAAADNPQRVRRRVNGGLNGYAQFIVFLNRAKKVFGCAV